MGIEIIKLLLVDKHCSVVQRKNINRSKINCFINNES